MAKQKKRMLVAESSWFWGACLSLLLMIGNYFIENVRYPFFDDIDLFAWYGHLTGHDDKRDFAWDDVVCVNVGLDKTMVNVIDVMGDKAGAISITDRGKLLQFLGNIANADYKEIFLDVRFPQTAEGLTSTECMLETDSETDKKLFTLISKMRNIVVATHSDISSLHPELTPKYGYADYGATVFTGFGRYELRQDGAPSAALKMYEDITGKGIAENGFFTNNGRLCHNTLFLRIPTSILYPTHYDDGAEVVNYRTLGADLLERNTAAELREMVKDRIVIIGDFEEDLHTTYVGEVPGSMLTYLAMKELEAGMHVVGWFELTAYIFFALLIGIRLKMQKCWYEYLPEIRLKGKAVNVLKHHNIVSFILSFFGWGVVMTSLKLAAWTAFGHSLPTLLPTLLFTLIDEYKRYNNPTLHNYII